MAVLPKIMTILTDLAISNSMSSFVPKYWLNWQILVAIFNEFRRQRWDHQSVYILVRPSPRPPPRKITETPYECIA